MNKTINPFYLNADGKQVNVYCRIKITDGNLSIVGVEGPYPNGNCFGGCGQIVMSYLENGGQSEYPMIFHDGWDFALWREFLYIWNKWHLNDMRSYCEHQSGWTFSKKLELNIYSWSDKFHKMRNLAADGELSEYGYKKYSNIAAKVMEATIDMKSAKYETPIVKSLLDNGWIVLEKTETKTAERVYPEEHPKGLLTKPCPVCGYQYGSAWLKQELPQGVIDFLQSLPKSINTPAWT